MEFRVRANNSISRRKEKQPKETPTESFRRLRAATNAPRAAFGKKRAKALAKPTKTLAWIYGLCNICIKCSNILFDFYFMLDFYSRIVK